MSTRTRTFILGLLMIILLVAGGFTVYLLNSNTGTDTQLGADDAEAGTGDFGITNNNYVPINPPAGANITEFNLDQMIADFPGLVHGASLANEGPGFSYPQYILDNFQIELSAVDRSTGQPSEQCVPKVCYEGASEMSGACGFKYQGGDNTRDIDNGAAPTPPGRSWTPYFLYTPPQCSFSFEFPSPASYIDLDILDIDTLNGTTNEDNEIWTVRFFDSDGNLAGDDIVVDGNYINQQFPNCGVAECGDGRGTRVNFQSSGNPVSRVQLIPSSNDPTWGLGFDNLRYVLQDTVPTEVTKLSNIDSVTSEFATITYTVTAINNNDFDINDVILWDTIPNQLNNIRSISDSGTYDSSLNRIRWDIPTLQANSQQNFTFVADVQSQFYGQDVTNLVEIFVDDNNDGTPQIEEKDDEADVVDNVDISQVVITKTSSVTANADGSTDVDYSILVENVSNVDINDYSVVDVLDSKVQSSWISQITGGGSITQSTSPVNITWDGINLIGGASVEFTYLVSIPQGNPGTYINVATLFDENGEEVDEDDEIVEISESDVVIIKDVVATEQPNGTTRADYTITVTNISTVAVADYSVVDVLDSKVQSSWISQITDGGSITQSTSPVNITWNGINLAAGANTSFTYTVTIPVGRSGDFENVATLFDENGSEVDDDDAIITIVPELPQTNLSSDMIPYLMAVAIIIFAFIVYQLRIGQSSLETIIGEGKSSLSNGFKQLKKQVDYEARILDD